MLMQALEEVKPQEVEPEDTEGEVKEALGEPELWSESEQEDEETEENEKDATKQVQDPTSIQKGEPSDTDNLASITSDNKEKDHHCLGDKNESKGDSSSEGSTSSQDESDENLGACLENRQYRPHRDKDAPLTGSQSIDHMRRQVKKEILQKKKRIQKPRTRAKLDGSSWKGKRSAKRNKRAAQLAVDSWF